MLGNASPGEITFDLGLIQAAQALVELVDSSNEICPVVAVIVSRDAAACFETPQARKKGVGCQRIGDLDVGGAGSETDEQR